MKFLFIIGAIIAAYFTLFYVITNNFLLGGIAFIILGLFLYMVMRQDENYSKRKDYICTACNYVGMPEAKLKGNFLSELIGGPLVTAYRVGSKEQVCPSCKNPTLIPITSPKGKELVSKTQSM